jgi:outer membrane protein
MMAGAKFIAAGALGRTRLALLSAVALLAFGTFAVAADLAPTKKAPPPPPPPVVAPSPFFVRLGFLYAVNSSSSKLYTQAAPGVNPQVLIPGVGANIANVATLGFEAGYFVTPNVSVDVSAGVPMWSKVTTKGAIVLPGPIVVPSGTPLATTMPSFIPVTLLYHFNQFGAFQPYLGAGVAPVFSFAQKSGFNTGVTVDPTIGLVLQAGADIMVDQHWGWSVDVKKLFASGESHGTGDNFAYSSFPAAGVQPIAGTLKTTFEPWIVSTGVTYRF